MTQNILKAIAFMELWMQGLTRFDGSTKIDHCARVYDSTSRIPEVTEDMEIAAILHDLVEDTAVTLGMVELAFGPGVRELVDRLTRRVKHNAIDGVDETYDQFVKRVCANPQAMLIKKADMCDNLSSLPMYHPLTQRYVNGLATLLANAVNQDLPL